jgi:PKD repeat protein
MSNSNIRYPNSFDGDDNLYHVNDSLRLTLAQDYNPGDTTIFVQGDPTIFARWPTNGLLTLTEQCNEVNKRAVSFAFTGVDTTLGTISNLVLRPGFPDVYKPQTVTDVTCNVMAEHHNSLKDALIAIQEFIGVKGTLDVAPFGQTLEGRINFLRQIVLQPKAWFETNITVGNIPLSVSFTNESFRLGTDGTSESVVVEWDFGDNTTSVVSTISTITASSVVPNIPNVYVIEQDDDGTIIKTYYNAGIYNVTLTVTNDFGSDQITFNNLINARIPAPNQAVMDFVVPSGTTEVAGVPLPPNANGQIITPGTPLGGMPGENPYSVIPTIRSTINTIIQIEIPTSPNPNTPGFSYAGEPLNGSGMALDPIISYTWALGDDLNHPNSPSTNAAYTIGGIYDIILRVDTEFGAYRITEYDNAVNIIENVNLWIWIFTDVSNTMVRAYEYGLISEAFKLTSNSTYMIERDASFLDNVPSATQQQQEFSRNNGFATMGTLASGAGGTVLLYWASGRTATDAVSTETINFVEYNGFKDTYTTQASMSRPWNWASFSSPSTATTYFSFGTPTSPSGPGTAFTNPVLQELNTISLGVSSTTLTNADFENGAQELLQNVDSTGVTGDFNVTRTAWKDSTGYIARNDGVGQFFRIKSFYGTVGSLGNQVQTIQKLIDIQGPTKLEGELGNLSGGIYMFNNSGSISVYNDSTSTWFTGGPGINSVAYLNLQDTTQVNYDDQSNTLLVATDSDSRAYITFDYSSQVFLKFSAIDLSFVTQGSRPNGDQWILALY